MRTRTFTEEIQRWRGSGMKTRLCFEGCMGDTKELEDLKFPADYTDFSGMFKNCKIIDTLVLSSWDVSNIKDLSYMFYGCYSLTAIPHLNTSTATNMSNMFYECYSLTAVPQLDTSAVTNMRSMFSACYSLTAIAFNGSVTGWAGSAVSLKGCSLSHAAIVAFFNSLPTITSAKAITLTGNPGVSELTDAEKAIATGKGWTLTL